MTTERGDRLRYVVVEGPIGVGKTTFARRLAEHWHFDSLLEASEANPFLQRFYLEGQVMALHTQLYFLFQRSDQLQGLLETDQASLHVVADFLAQKDPLFAALNLQGDEWDLYRRVLDKVSLNAPVPDLVIYLQASVEQLLERIKQRGRPEERGMDVRYLQRICDAYTEFFYQYEESPLLVVNTQGLDLTADSGDFQWLLERIGETQYGRHYFNPVPLRMG
jgi:deoxyguanosine kinase